ncbi:MAG: hypothetical protein IMZ75_17060 [Actinobacteria bacterium]|nr:hypothetical protein [Actinomycetota bacterium]
MNTDVDVAPYRDPDQLGTTRDTSSGVQNDGSVPGEAGPLDTRGANGFNGQGLQALSGINNHPLGPATGFDPYSARDGTAATSLNLGHVGMAYWDESQCQACGDHEGENAPAKIISEP